MRERSEQQATRGRQRDDHRKAGERASMHACSQSVRGSFSAALSAAQLSLSAPFALSATAAAAAAAAAVVARSSRVPGNSDMTDHRLSVLACASAHLACQAANGAGRQRKSERDERGSRGAATDYETARAVRVRLPACASQSVFLFAIFRTELSLHQHHQAHRQGSRVVRAHGLLASSSSRRQ